MLIGRASQQPLRLPDLVAPARCPYQTSRRRVWHQSGDRHTQHSTKWAAQSVSSAPYATLRYLLHATDPQRRLTFRLLPSLSAKAHQRYSTLRPAVRSSSRPRSCFLCARRAGRHGRNGRYAACSQRLPNPSGGAVARYDNHRTHRETSDVARSSGCDGGQIILRLTRWRKGPPESRSATSLITRLPLWGVWPGRWAASASYGTHLEAP